MSDDLSRVATALFRSGCIRFGSFKIKSGALSPYYIDLGGLLSSPRELVIVAKIVGQEIERIMARVRIDKLASIELRGALILPSIACRVDVPCVVVRKEEKAYGVTGRIVGAKVAKGDSILFFDDVISEGLSKVEGIKPLEEFGAKIEHVLVVVDREQGGRENLEKMGYTVHASARISELTAKLLESKSISSEQADAVFDYIKKGA